MLNAPIPIQSAPLPTTYEAAKAALAECERIDECQGWANKAEALAAYARMADDDTLRKLADRIQARAVRRVGELLQQFRPAPGTRVDLEPRVPGEPRTISELAMDANLSGRQRKTALRIANIPAEEFEAAIESDAPPTVTRLAEMGKQSRSAPEGFKEASRLIGTVRRFAEFCEANAPARVANGVMASEAAELDRLLAGAR